MWSEEDVGTLLDGVSRLGWLVLKRFSTAYKPSDVLAAFACLSPDDFEYLRRLHFAMSAETFAFLSNHVPAFLRAIPSTTEHVLEDRRGGPRGRIDWAKTFARRTQSGSDTTRFITRPIERTADSLAARIVAFMLRRIEQNADWLSKRQPPAMAAGSIEDSGIVARRGLAILRGRGVSVPTRLTPRDVSPARQSRRSDVASAIRVFDQFMNLVELANANLLRTLLSDRQMAPENLDDLFEVWTLLTLVERHLVEGWDLVDARLIGPDAKLKRPKFTLRKQERTADLFYQTVPQAIAKASVYKAIFQDYDLDVSQRRPDITVELNTPDGSQTIIVEVKRTEDAGYIVDSVYKTLGYIADFRSVIGPNMPMALLVVWKGIAGKHVPSPDSPIRIFTAQSFKTMEIPY